MAQRRSRRRCVARGDGAADAAASPRICGLANKGLLQKRPLKQAEVLRVSEVIALERLLADDSLDLTDRVFAGHLLMILFGRMRWSDGLHLCSMELDVDEFGDGFLETSTLTSKTSSTIRKKRTFLPFTILANGISEQRWATIWLNLRSASNLTPHTSERFGETVEVLYNSTCIATSSNNSNMHNNASVTF